MFDKKKQNPQELNKIDAIVMKQELLSDDNEGIKKIK